MTDAAHLLRLLAWLSPAFPTGGYAYSHGLEWAVQVGDVRDGDTLRDWLHDVLAHGSGRNDAILLRHAHCACDDKDTLAKIAALASAAVPGRERRNETRAQGAAFMLASAPWRGGLSRPDDLPYPVAVGALAGTHGVAEDDAAIAYLHGFTSNLISAAVRLVPLGQSVGLTVLAALEPTILRVANGTRTAALDDIGGCVFRADIASLRHETQYTRLFRS
ncbi:MAG: urease accessory protein UreF [Alphaproteobacteria bacterium]|nr:urease accessory protein UreF [Alphaproteobacteria bacterium]